MNEAYRAALAAELARVTESGWMGGTFTLSDGTTVKGATETDTIKHLTSKRDYVDGRKHTFPGIGNGWVFESSINEAGYVIVDGRNKRGQQCAIVTKKSA